AGAPPLVGSPARPSRAARGRGLTHGDRRPALPPLARTPAPSRSGAQAPAAGASALSAQAATATVGVARHQRGRTRQRDPACAAPDATRGPCAQGGEGGAGAG